MRFSSPNSYEIASPSEEPLSARRSRRVGRQPLKFLLAESAESEEEVSSAPVFTPEQANLRIINCFQLKAF